MSCTPAYFAGIGDCQSLLKKTSGAVLQEKGQTWTDATAITAASWQTAIADDSAATRNAIALPVLSFSNTTDEPEVLTSPLGKKSKGSNPIPSGVLYLDSSLCDYKTLHAHRGKSYEYIPFFEDGTFWMTRKADGTLKGFRVSVETVAGLPPEDANNSFPVMLFFDSEREFQNVVVVSDFDWSFDDILDYVPVGVNIRVTTAYSSGTVTVLATKTGSGDAMTGLSSATDWEIMKSNATPTVVTTAVTENGLGSYTLTIKKDNDGTPANLAAGDYVYLQAHDDDGTNLTYLSNAIKLFGG